MWKTNAAGEGIGVDDNGCIKLSRKAALKKRAEAETVSAWRAQPRRATGPLIPSVIRSEIEESLFNQRHVTRTNRKQGLDDERI